MIDSLENIIRTAGKIILKYYKCSCSYEFKEDRSPITIADVQSNLFLIESLQNLLSIPVLSEEQGVIYDTRKNWDAFWLIDPLDGTKNFISNSDDFCINIALIKNNKPIAGLIYAPALDELYFAQEGKGFKYKGQPKPFRKDTRMTAVVSRFHHSEITQKFLNLNRITNTVTIGAAIKFGRMALGEFDIYPRFEGSKEWDIGAGQIILKESGCNIFDLKTQAEPLYNKPSFKNNYFFAYRPTVDITQFKWLNSIDNLV